MQLAEGLQTEDGASVHCSLLQEGLAGSCPLGRNSLLRLFPSALPKVLLMCVSHMSSVEMNV